MFRYLLLLCFSIAFVNSFAQHRTLCKKIERVNDLIQSYHVKPQPIDDDYSVSVWQNFVEVLDPDHKYLLQTDIESFSEDKYKLDDYFLDGQCRFIKSYTKTLSKRLKQTKDILVDLKDVAFEYPETDSIYFNKNKTRGYSENLADLKDDWLWLMRYSVLREAGKRYDDKQALLDNFERIKPELQEYVINKAICAINEIQNHPEGFDEYIHELLLNAMTGVNDPHSVYFNNSEKNAFDNSLSSSNESFGIWTDKNDEGQIVISYVNSNSPAALKNQIEVGDILRSLKHKRNQINTSCVSNREVINFLNNEDYKEVEFEIEKSRGQIKTVLLTKTNIPVEYNAVDAFIINKDIKAGYVNVPGFYLNTDNYARGTSLDMGKALYKLALDKVDGLIIDLRKNGGGSMKEAVDLVNIFLDGPMSILRQNEDIVTISNDDNANFFKKPIIIMVDAYTASAAELFAGTMQDYNRAVIVGDNTYGKATMQYVYEVDPERKDYGFLKITTDKFYRVTGKSHQVFGIQPDIHITSLYEDFSSRERDLSHAIIPDTLNISEQINTFELSKEFLKQKSEERQNNSEIFKQIKTFNEQLDAEINYKSAAYALKVGAVYEDSKSYEQIWENINAYFQDQKYIAFEKTTYDQKFVKTKDQKRMELIMEYSSGDPMILESFRILEDLISLKK